MSATNLQCRLCSAKASLISLFCRKGREIRDFIRKLVEYTIGIEFQEDDSHSRICVTCVIQTYNFYVFYMKSVENDQRLRELEENFQEKTSKKKCVILNLNEIELPELEILKSTLAPWLISKQNYCLNLESDNESAGNSLDIAPRQEHVTNNHVTERTEVQYESNSLKLCNGNGMQLTKKDKCTCENLPKNVSKRDINTQTDERVNLEDKSIQCELKNSFKVNNQGIQCQIVKIDNGNKIIQCKLKTPHCQGLCECGKDSYLFDCKEEIIPPLLSPSKSLSLSMKTEKSRSPSPLVLIQKNIQYLKKCKYCDIVTNTQYEMKRHIKIHLICSICKKKFTSIKKTILHKKKECELKYKTLSLKVILPRMDFSSKYKDMTKSCDRHLPNDSHSPKKLKKQ